MKQAKPDWRIIILLAIVKFCLPFILQSPVYELQRDEYLYYQQGLHLDLGYLENPPLLSYLGTISSWLGGSEFWIKFWPSLLGACTVVVTCLVAAEFGGRLFAQLIAGLGILTGAYLRMHSLFQPNILDIFFWTLAIYFFVRFIKTTETRFLYGFIFSLVLGWWGKYSVVFLVAAIFIALLLSQHRPIFLQRRTYLAILIGLVLILPNVWWQYNHKWPLIHHMQELQQTQLQFLNPFDFIKDQLLYLLPVVFVWIAGLIWLFKKRQWGFLGWTYFFVIALLIIGRGKSYYSMGIYPVLLAAGGVTLEQWTESKRWLRPTFAIVILALTIPFIPLLLPIWKPEKLAKFYRENKIDKTGLLKWEDQQNHPLPQDFADMLGWKELTEKTEAFFMSLPDSTKANTFVNPDNYGEAGAFKFYGKDDSFKSRTVTGNGSFILWLPDSLSFRNVIFTGSEMPDWGFFKHFEKSITIDSVTNRLSRQFGEKIFYFQNIDTTGLRMLTERVTYLKTEFAR